MKSLIILICLLISCTVLSQKTYKDCLDSVKQLFQTPQGKEKAKEFLKFQGKLTVHRLAFALGMNNPNAERFRVENEIRRIISDIDEQVEDDPSFAAAKEDFEKNPLSRTVLARIMPFISNILNTQISNSNPNDKKYYHLQQSDMKMLAILAEKEVKNGDYYDHILKNDSTDRGILNYIKVINSSMRGRKPAPLNLRIFKRQMNTIQTQINSLIENMGIGEECQNLFSQLSSCEMDNILENDLVDIINSISDLDKHERLKYNSYWLHVSASHSATVPAPRPPYGPTPTTPKEKRIIQSVLEVPEEVEIEVDTQRELLLELSEKVLGEFDYYFDTDSLLEDPELLIAVAKAMDRHSDQISYEGKLYHLPETYNRTSNGLIFNRNIEEIGRRHYDTGPTGFNISNYLRLQEKKEELLQYEDELCGRDDDVSRLRDLAYYMHGAQKLRMKAFEFHDGSFCDSQTGKRLSNSIEGFLSFEVGTASPESDEINIVEQNEQAVQRSLNQGLNSVVIKDKVYTLSGVEIESESNETPQQTQARHEGHKYFFDGEKVKRTDNASIPLTLTQARNVIQNFHRQTLGQLNYTAPTTLPDQQIQLWAMAIENQTPFYYFADKAYSRLSDEPISRAPASVAVENSDLRDDRETREYELQINSLPDREKIIRYHQLYPSDCETYTIVDKKSGSLTVFNNDGEVLMQPREVLTGASGGDKAIRRLDNGNSEQKMRTNNSTGAGIYMTAAVRSGDDHPYYRQFEGNLLALRYESGSHFKQGSREKEESLTAIHQVPTHLLERYNFFDGDPLNNDVTSGCINMTHADFNRFLETINPQPNKECPVYVLPVDEDLHFYITNSKLKFGPKSREFCKPTGQRTNTDGTQADIWSDNWCHEDYYFSKHIPGEADDYRPIELRFTDQILEEADDKLAPLSGGHAGRSRTRTRNRATENINKFTDSIETNKQQIMERTGLTNSEYNDLARVAVAVMGVESDFCTSQKLKFKEDNQTAVDIVKSLTGRKGETNSRGCTQIKDASRILNAVGLKERAKSFDEETLMDPEVSAEVTMYYLALALEEMQREKRQGGLEVDFRSRDSNKYGLSNTQDYIYYLYQGSKYRLRQGSATPDLSIAVGEISRILDHVYLFQGTN